MNKRIRKEKSLGILINFHELNNLLISWDIILKQLDKNFKKVYLINSQNLELFPIKEKKVINKKLVKKLNLKNLYFEDIKNRHHFENFVKDKELYLINSNSKNLNLIRVYFLIKKFKIKQFQITNVGNEQYSNVLSNKFIFKKILFIFKKKINPFIVTLLSLVGIISKIEIRFTSIKTWIDGINRNPIKKFLHNKGFFYAKKLILVNSMAYDRMVFDKEKTSEKYIVHIDASLNYYHKTDVRGVLDKKSYENHYKYLNIFLKNISKLYNKKIIVCIHPSYNLNEHKKMLASFKVVKFKTRDYIKKAFLVTFFDSTVILDALIQQKRVVGIISEYTSQNDVLRQTAWSKNIGCTIERLNKNYKFNKKKYIYLKKNNKKKYQIYLKNYLQRETEPGINKIIKYLKKNYIK